MPIIKMVENLTFTFQDDWIVDKYDDSNYYRLHFSKQLSGIKAVDLLAVSPQNVAYLIEVKDYRHPDTEKIKPSDLADAIARKVLDTLAAMLPVRLKASDQAEQSLAARVLACEDLKVFAHLELPRAHRGVVDPADIKQKLRQRLAAVDRHAKVVNIGSMKGTAWNVA
ncbi:hypothetical protein [Achromobacter aegrifaciens]